MKQSALTTEQQMVEAVSPMVVVPEDRERGLCVAIWRSQSGWSGDATSSPPGRARNYRFSQPGLRLTKHLECLQVPTHSGSALLA